MADEGQAVSDSTSTPERFHEALAAVAAVIRAQRNRRENFRDHDAAHFVNNALKELESWESGDDSTNHLALAAAAALMALQLDQERA